jgi:hypothetical protein
MRATLARFPGTMQPVEIADQLVAPLGALLQQAGIDDWKPGTDARDVAVNGVVTSDPAQLVPDGAQITVSERVKGAR